MNELLQNFEQAAARFNPALTIGLGAFLLLLGLFLWLGGLGFKKAIAAIIGAFVGSLCGYMIFGFAPLPVLILLAAGAAVGTIAQKAPVILMAAAIAFAIAFAFIAIPYVADEHVKFSNSINADSLGFLTVNQTLQNLKAYLCDLNTLAQLGWLQSSSLNRLAMAASAVIIMTIACFFFRLICALCCSVLGTAFTFAGIILLLLYKGSLPIGHIQLSPLFFGGVFIAMTAFGTIEQLFVTWPSGKKIKKSKKPKKVKQSQQQAPSEPTYKNNWRGA